MKNGRRKFSGEEKIAILRLHLLEKMPVSDVCDRAGISPTLFYRWQKELFENGAAAFGRRGTVLGQRGGDGQHRKLEEKVVALQRKLADKDEVIGEIMESHVRLKKVLAKPDRWLGGAGRARCGDRLRRVLDRAGGAFRQSSGRLAGYRSE